MGDAVASDQSTVVAFLESRSAYPGAPGRIERIDTHGAIVFLAGERAYKLKRAVKLPYLDFSTLERRRRVLERELEINRQFAPKLYLEVAPIVRDERSGELGIGGEGRVEDWLLVMRRFEQEAIFDRLAAAGGLSAPAIWRLGRLIADFHERAPSQRQTQWLASLSKIACDLEEALCGPEAKRLGLRLDPYLEKLKGCLAESRALLDARERAGLVRRCHGDLHLSNIVLFEGEPTLFDALEFDETLATIDVLYDLAFLLMDLWASGLRAHANAAINSYFQREAAAVEWEGLALLPLFLSLRAAIRAMVGLHRLSVNATGEGEALAEISRYAELAGEFLAPRPARLIAIGGLSGAGKTTVSRALAPLVGAPPGAIHLRSDVERKLMRGAPLEARLPPEAYALEAQHEVYRRLLDKAGIVLRAGSSAVIDAVWLIPRWREAAEDLARKAGVAFDAVWLEAGSGELMARVGARVGDASDADAEVVQMQLKTATAPQDWRRADARGSIETAAGLAAEALGIDPEQARTSARWRSQG